MLEAANNHELPPIPGKRYFTIGEVSDLCAVKPHVLRYWEQEYPQLKPLKRRGNRRYYQHHVLVKLRQPASGRHQGQERQRRSVQGTGSTIARRIGRSAANLKNLTIARLFYFKPVQLSSIIAARMTSMRASSV